MLFCPSAVCLFACPSGSRLLLKEKPPLGRGEGVKGQKKVCAPKISLKFPARLINFIF